MSATEVRAAHAHKPKVSFRTYYHDSDILKERDPWFYTLKIEWNTDPDGSYTTSSSICFNFYNISEVWEFANQMAEANEEIVAYAMDNHAEFVASRTKQTAEVK